MLIGLGTGVEVGMAVAASAGAAGNVAVGAEIVVTSGAGAEESVVGVPVTGAGTPQDDINRANTRMKNAKFLKTVSFRGSIER
jgi:hypothetical protein